MGQHGMKILASGYWKLPGLDWFAFFNGVLVGGCRLGWPKGLLFSWDRFVPRGVLFQRRAAERPLVCSWWILWGRVKLWV